MTKTQENQIRLQMNSALGQSLTCESQGVAAVRSCLETALANCRALAVSGALKDTDRHTINATFCILRSQGFYS